MSTISSIAIGPFPLWQTRQELEDSYNSEAEQAVQDDLWNMIVENCTQLKDFPQV